MKIKVLFLLPLLALLQGCINCGSGTVDIDGKDHYKVTYIGDIHYDGQQYHIEPLSERAAKLHYTQWQGTSQKVLAAAGKQSSGVPFVVQLGDMINGDCDNAELQGAALRDAFAEIKRHFPGKKLLSLAGNHDHRGRSDASQAPDKYLIPLLKKELGKEVKMTGTNYAVRYGKDLYIFYDYRKKESGDLVKKVLADSSDARHIFFLSHLPMFPCTIGNPGWVVPQFKELIPLLAEKKAVIVCGHIHSMSHIVYKSRTGFLPQITVTSMGREWLKGIPAKTRYNCYDAWYKNIKPHYFTTPRYKWSIENLKYFRNGDFSSYNVGFLEPSGFVQIEVNGNDVYAHIFSDDSGKPAKSIILKKNNKTVASCEKGVW